MSIFAPFHEQSPVILTIPGLGGSGPSHWQSLWEDARQDTIRADLGLWDAPLRNAWVTKLDQIIRQLRAPVILAAHSLGCVGAVWWAAMAERTTRARVAGALLVAPADVDRPGAPDVVDSFRPTPAVPLPFRSIVVASTNDPWMRIVRARELAQAWGSHFVDAGALGHINADSGIGWWRDGQQLLQRLIDTAVVPPPFPPGSSAARLVELPHARPGGPGIE